MSGHGGHGGHGHGHGQAHARDAAARSLTWAVLLTASFVVVEAAAGYWTGGLSLLADAAHMLADSSALALALVAGRWAKRPPTARSTFGHRRAEVIAAFVNGIVLALMSIGLVVEAVERWRETRPILALPMVVAATAGLLVNVTVAAILARAGKESLNVRAAAAHVLADALGSVGAIVAGGLVLAFDWRRADAVVSIGIAGLVAWSGWRVLRETTGILLEAAPAHIDVAAVDRVIRAAPGVAGVHDLHVWRISDRFDALTVHVTLAPESHGVEVCRDVAQRLEAAFGLEHVTVQPEASPPKEVVPLRRSKDGVRVGQ